MKIFFCIVLLISSVVLPQNIIYKNGIPRDTSFTIYSEEQKIKKLYPFVEIVKPNLTDEVILQQDIVYIKYNKRELHLDLFLPQKKLVESIPCVVIIHGGGWYSGDKNMEWPIAVSLSSNGFAAATVEYRLSPEALFPSAVYDLKNAIKWIKSRSEQYNIDTNRIAVLGCSAGGQLAALLGATNNNVKFEPNNCSLTNSSYVNAIIDIDGILDFTDPAESGKDTDSTKPSAGKRWLGFSFKEKPNLWIDASPITYINPNTPPTLFINSSLVRFRAGRDSMIEKLNKYKIYYEVYELPDTPHTFWMFNPWFDKTKKVVLDFLNRIF